MKRRESNQDKIGVKMQTFTIQKNCSMKNQNYDYSESFIDSKREFFNYYFNDLLMNKTKLTDTIMEHQKILQILHEENKIDIFELNMLESLILKVVEDIKHHIFQSDAIVVKFERKK